MTSVIGLFINRYEFGVAALLLYQQVENTSSYSNSNTSYFTELNNTDTIQEEWRLIVGKESARKFLKDTVDDIDLRNRFNLVRNSDEFIKIAAELGYLFTSDNLLTVVKE
jgi:hypothetical protein